MKTKSAEWAEIAEMEEHVGDEIASHPSWACLLRMDTG